MIASMVWEDRSGVRPVKYRPGDVIPDDHPRRAWLLRYGIAVVEKPVEPVEAPVEADGEADPEVEPVEAPVEADGEADPEVEPVEADGDGDPVESDDVEDDDTDPVGPVEADGRPRKTAPVAAWRKFADAQGLPHKGLSKQQIIAALT